MVAAATVTVRVPTVTISAVPNRVQSGGATTVSWSAENVNSSFSEIIFDNFSLRVHEPRVVKSRSEFHSFCQ